MATEVEPVGAARAVPPGEQVATDGRGVGVRVDDARPVLDREPPRRLADSPVVLECVEQSGPQVEHPRPPAQALEDIRREVEKAGRVAGSL